MKVLVACEMSGVVRRAFAERGHDAWSCDILPSMDNSPNHIQDDIFKVIACCEDFQFDLMIAHPPCTYITNAGVRHLHSVPSKNGKVTKVHGKDRWEALEKACQFFKLLKDTNIPKICVENPIPHKYAVYHEKYPIGKYTQLIQPWQFGHKETKATCLWLKNLPKLVPTNIVGPAPKKKDVSSAEYALWHRVHYCSPGEDRAMIRSITFDGIGQAMADQFGGICE